VDDIDILLVEDNANDAELTLRALKKISLANKLLWVKDGAEALDFLFATGGYATRDPNIMPRLVLLDIKLPKIDGVEVLRRVKSDARTRALPVVMLTSSAEERDVLQSYHLGVNSYIVKPVDFSRFVQTVADVGLYWMIINNAPH
jgi:two-component system, response regulator